MALRLFLIQKLRYDLSFSPQTPHSCSLKGIHFLPLEYERRIQALSLENKDFVRHSKKGNCWRLKVDKCSEVAKFPWVASTLTASVVSGILKLKPNKTLSGQGERTMGGSPRTCGLTGGRAERDLLSSRSRSRSRSLRPATPSQRGRPGLARLAASGLPRQGHASTPLPPAPASLRPEVHQPGSGFH